MPMPPSMIRSLGARLAVLAQNGAANDLRGCQDGAGLERRL